MPNLYANKIIYGGQTLIDLTGDTVAADKLLEGYTAHDKSGATITGTCDYDAKTTDANAIADEILSGKTAYVNKSKVTGTMPNRESANVVVSSLQGTAIQNGYYDGSGKAVIDSTSSTNLIPSNIRNGVAILGVTGTMSGEDSLNIDSINVTPYTTAQTITAASKGLDYISQVSVAAIAYTETDNAQGGKTITIGTIAPT